MSLIDIIQTLILAGIIVFLLEKVCYASYHIFRWYQRAKRKARLWWKKITAILTAFLVGTGIVLVIDLEPDIPDDPVSDNWWIYQEKQSYEIYNQPLVNWSKFWNVFKTHSLWTLEAWHPVQLQWVDATELLTIDRNYNANNSCKINLSFTTPDNGVATNWRFTLAIDYRVRQYINRTGNHEYTLSYYAWGETFNVTFNWSDMLQYSGLVFKHGVKEIDGKDYFWFRVRRDNIPPGFHVDIDPQYTVESTAGSTTMWSGNNVVRLSNDSYYVTYAVGTLQRVAWSWDSGVTWDDVIPFMGDLTRMGSIAVDSNDTVHLVVSGESGLNADDDHIRYSNSTDFSNFRNISYTDTQIYVYPDIAVDSNDNLVVVYERDDTGDSEVFFMKSTDNGASWSNPTQLTNEFSYSDDAWNPVIEVNSSDSYHVVFGCEDHFSNKDDILHMQSNDGGATWSGWEADPVYQATETNGVTSLAIDDNDRLVVSFREKNANDAWYICNRTSDSGWTDAEELGTNACDYPSVAISDNDSTYVMVSQPSGADVDVYYNYSSSSFTIDANVIAGTYSHTKTVSRQYPVIGGAKTNRPENGYAFAIIGSNNNVSFYKSPTLTWESGTYQNNDPIQSGESPVNASSGSALTPNCHVVVIDNDGDTMNATWWSNSSGSWLQFGVANTSVASGTNITQVGVNFSVNFTKYWWRVNLSDGEGGWTNDTYYFTTTTGMTIPNVTINFAGNLSDSGGPYWRPPGESDILDESGEGIWRDGYYTNASYQHEDWIYVNVTAQDDEVAVTNVWLNWLNETTWTNWTYPCVNTDANFWEFNTSGNIMTHADYNYSFNIVANSSDGSNNVGWNKTGIPVGEVRRFVRLNCTPVNISYSPYYLYELVYENDDRGREDNLKNDGGPDGSLIDTGVFNSTLSYGDTMLERRCLQFAGWWFEDTRCVEPITIENIYYHIWWSTDDGILDDIGYSNQRESLFSTQNESYRTDNGSARSKIYYDQGNVFYNNTYSLETHLFDSALDISYTDNDIYELAISVVVIGLDYPSVISNISVNSFIIFNVPSNATLNASHADTDSDSMSDWDELYVNFTSPFLSDTDNDGVTDTQEIIDGTDPNNYSDFTPAAGAPNNDPNQSGESPVNSSTGITLRPDVYVICKDPNTDTMNATWWSNSSGPWVQFAVANTSISNDTNITQNFVNASSYTTKYWWSLNLTDGEGGWDNDTYHLTTETNDAPSFSGASPVNESTEIPTTPNVYIIVTDTNNDTTCDFYTSPDGSAWTWKQTNSSVASGTNITYAYSGASVNSTTYYWRVTANDGSVNITSEDYEFTTPAWVPETITVGDLIPVNRTKMTVTWTNGANTSHQYIRYLSGGTGPANRASGTFLYNGTGATTVMTGLNPGTTYTCSFWAYNDTENVFSASYVQVADKTDFNLNVTMQGEVPANGTTAVENTYATVNVTLEDPEGDTFNWTIQGDNITSASANNVNNGSKSANTITPLPYSTTHRWWVNVTDIFGNETKEWYEFTVRDEKAVGTIATGDVIPINRTKMKVEWTNGVNTSNQYIRYLEGGVGPANRASGTFLYNGTGLTVDMTGLKPGTTYTCSFWGYNDTDNVFSASKTSIGDITDWNANVTMQGEVPANGTTVVAITQATVNVTLEDPEGDTFNWTIQGVGVTSNSANGETNGSKSANTITPLSFKTLHTWWVNVTDIFDNVTKEWYTFTTRDQHTPQGIATGDVVPVNRTKLKCEWTRGTNTSHVYINYNTGSAPNTRAEGTFLYNGTALLSYATGLQPGTLYYFSFWGYNDTDNLWSSKTPISDITDWNKNTTYSNENPANGTSGQPFAFTWNITIEDPEGDTFNWTIECENGDTNSANVESNGSKTLSISGLASLTDYNVWVNATDVFGNVTTAWYNFSTQLGNSPPSQSGESPVNGSAGLEKTPSLYVIVTDTDGDTINATWWSNSSGSWIQFGVANTTEASGTNITQDNSNFSAFSTTYWWEVRIQDGEAGFNNETYSFTTRAEHTPGLPIGFSATANNRTKITCTWTKGANTDNTYIRYKQGATPPSDTTDGTLLYNGTGTTVSATGLSVATQYSFKAWVWNATDNVWDGTVTDDAITDFNLPTVFSGVDPANGSTNQPLSVSWNLTIEDPEGDTFNWTLQGSNGGADSGNDDTNKSVSMGMSGLSFATTYTVWVNATDIWGNLTKEWFTFTTNTNTTPVFSSPGITNGTTGVNKTTTTIWNITIVDDYDTFNWTIETQPNVGTNSSNGDTNGSKETNLTGLAYATWYTVYVNATDGNGWTREWFRFKTESAPGAVVYHVGIRNTAIDYFIWLGDNGSAWLVAQAISGFNEVAEKIRAWKATTWDPTDGCWQTYYGDGSGTNFSVSTFDIIEVTLTDAGSQTISVTENTDIDYDKQRSIDLTNAAYNKGYNYTGYTSTTSSTLGNVASNNISMTLGDFIGMWDNSSYIWRFYIVGFGGEPSKSVARWQVCETYVGTSRTWTM